MRHVLDGVFLLLMLPAAAFGQTGWLPVRALQDRPADPPLSRQPQREWHNRYDEVGLVSYTSPSCGDLAAMPQEMPCGAPVCGTQELSSCLSTGAFPPCQERRPWLDRLQTGVNATWLPGSGDDLGMHIFDVYSSYGIGDTGFVITPGGGMHLLDGPTSTDLPPRLYNLYLDILRYEQINERFGVELGVTPTYYSDFDATNSDAFRLLGRTIGFYAVSDAMQLVFGAVYLDIGDEIPLLPVAGVIWAPCDDVRYELVFPQPVIGRRIQASACHERWLYLAGEFGGGSWAIERAFGGNDVANYSDWRLMAGLETRFLEGSGWRAELGYVFGRWLDYDSARGNFEIDSTAMARLAFWF